MFWEVLGTSVLLMLSRIADVTIGTLRTVFIIQGRRGVASALGFVEVTVWILAVSAVIANIDENPIYIIPYGLGFALGNYIGLTLERWIATGKEVLLFFSRNGIELAKALRDKGFAATAIQGEGRDGPIAMILAEMPRRKIRPAVECALRLDPKCFYIIQDVRTASTELARLPQPSGWRAILKKK